MYIAPREIIWIVFAVRCLFVTQMCLYLQVVLPEIASIRLAVYEDSGKLIGHRVLPVVGLCPGYRHVGLRNEANQPLAMAQLFLTIVVKDYVPHGMSDLAEALSNPIEYHSKRDKRDHQLSVLTDGTGVDDLLQNEDKEKEVKEISAETEVRAISPQR